MALLILHFLFHDLLFDPIFKLLLHCYIFTLTCFCLSPVFLCSSVSVFLILSLISDLTFTFPSFVFFLLRHFRPIGPLFFFCLLLPVVLFVFLKTFIFVHHIHFIIRLYTCSFSGCLYFSSFLSDLRLLQSLLLSSFWTLLSCSQKLWLLVSCLNFVHFRYLPGVLFLLNVFAGFYILWSIFNCFTSYNYIVSMYFS